MNRSTRTSTSKDDDDVQAAAALPSSRSSRRRRRRRASIALPLLDVDDVLFDRVKLGCRRAADGAKLFRTLVGAKRDFTKTLRAATSAAQACLSHPAPREPVVVAARRRRRRAFFEEEEDEATSTRGVKRFSSRRDHFFFFFFVFKTRPTGSF